MKLELHHQRMLQSLRWEGSNWRLARSLTEDCTTAVALPMLVEPMLAQNEDQEFQATADAAWSRPLRFGQSWLDKHA